MIEYNLEWFFYHTLLKYLMELKQQIFSFETTIHTFLRSESF